MEQLSKPTSTSNLPQAKNAISLTWANLSYAIRPLTSFRLRQPAKVLLRQLTGHCTIHSLNGFLGPSGSGKTTLLNCLSGLRRPSGKVQLFDTTADSSSVFSTKTLYFIEQHVEETILSQLSVGQILHYAFAFKNGRSTSKEQMKVHLGSIMSQLLLPIELLRRPFHLCSGGEQKRIAIAQELMSLTMPAFLFIDEPTTGLDTSAAVQVVQCLGSLAERYPMTILASIHAPNEEILSCFTQLYVLAKGGVAIYWGEPEGIALKLEEATGSKVPVGQPPIEALLKVACNGAEDEVVVKLSSECQDNTNASATTNSTTLATLQHSFFSLEHLFLQLTRLGHYQFIVNWRTFLGTLLQSFLLFALIVSFFPAGMAEITQCFPIDEKSSVNGTTLLPVCSKESLDQGILKRENSAFLAYSFVFSSTNFVIFAITFYGPIVKVFQSEHRNNWYSLGVFYVSSTIISLLETASLSLVISTAIYFLSGQHGADGYSLHPVRLTYFTLSWLLLSLYCQSIGSFLALLFAGHQDVALFISFIVCSEIALMNNLVVNFDSSGNGLLILLSDLIGSKDIGKLFLYVIYGIDRCPEGTFEKDIKGYNVEEAHIFLYIGRVLGIIVFLKLLGFLFLYSKYSASWWKKTVSLPELEKLPTITEYSEQNLVTESKQSSTVPPHVPESSQIIVAFHFLTLYTSNSIYELATERTSGTRILSNLHGALHFGNLVGLMGPSGAGKTSLLRVLNGQLKDRLDASSQFFLSTSTFISTCFISQQVSGHLASGLTALQSLIYASKLKNVGQSSVDHTQVAMNILKQLDLEAISSTRVERCSGGERKRLALGLELTATCLPNLIIIDEPTSGLDSNSAEIVIKCLKKLVSRHRNSLTIVASLHQPNTEILQQIDWLYVLAKGGVRVFEGPPGDVLAFLQKVTHTSVVTNTQKVAFPVEQLIGYCNLHSIDSQIQQMVEESDLKQSNVNISTLCLVPDGIPLNRCRFTLEASFTLAHRYLVRIRNHLWKNWLREIFISLSFSLFLRVIFPASIAFPSGCMNIETDDLSAAALDASCTGNAYEESQKLEVVLNNYRYVYHLSASFLLSIMFKCSLDLSGEFHNQFGNEHRNGWYSTGAFYLQHSLIDMIPPLVMVLTHSYVTNIYSQVLPSLYWNMVALLLLGALAYQGIGHLIGILSKGSLLLQVAYLFTVYIIFTMLSNFFITIAKMNSVYQFVANFCPPRYAFEGILLLQYGFGRCRSREIQPILYSLNLEDADYSTIILALIGNILFYRVLAVAVILFKTRQPVNRKKRAAKLIQFRSGLTSNCIIAGLDRSETTFEIKVRK